MYTCKPHISGSLNIARIERTETQESVTKWLAEHVQDILRQKVSEVQTSIDFHYKLMQKYHRFLREKE